MIYCLLDFQLRKYRDIHFFQSLISFYTRRAAHRLAIKSGLVSSANTKPGKHIPWDHPALVQMRSWISYQIEVGNIHPQLVCNFDQTWSLNFQPGRKTVQVRKRGKPMSEEKNHHKQHLKRVIARSLGLPLPAERSEDGAVAPQVTGGMSAMNVVDGWRIPHTLTTLSWIDGVVGRGWITCSSHTLSEQQRTTLNEECKSWLEIGPLQDRSHIWSCETFLDYMFFLEGEIRARRRALGLDIKSRVLVICDCASQHSIKKFFSIKDRWCAKHNVVPCHVLSFL